MSGAMTVVAALSALIDYAGLFPPAKLEMEPSLREYLEARAGAHAWMLGRFITPESRIGDLLAALPSNAGKAVPLSVIVDAGTDPRTWFGNASLALERIAELRTDGRVTVEALEMALPPLAFARETYEATIGQAAGLLGRFGLRELPAFVEIPRDARFEELLEGALEALARYRLGGKVRCGGVVPSAYPSVREVAMFLARAHEAGVPFKATAGLHHPIRHYNEAAAATMHGFLNILAGTAFAARGVDAISDIIADEDAASFSIEGGALRWREWTASADEVAVMRRDGFVAYGSCSFAEPVDDLTAMHII